MIQSDLLLLFWRVHGYLHLRTPLSLLWRAIGFFFCRSSFTLLAADIIPCALYLNWLFRKDTNCVAVFAFLPFSFCTSVSLVFHAVSPRPGLVKLLALSYFQARSRSLRDTHLTGHLGQFLVIVDTSVIGASFFLSDARSCHRYLEPTDCSAPISPASSARRWLDSGMVLSSLIHSTAEVNLF